MPTAQGATFGGLSLRGCVFPFSRGITPSLFTLYFPAYTATVDHVGTLSFSNGLNFTNCAISGAFIRRYSDGKWPTWAVHGCDRRWAWAGKRVSGDYNRRASDGTVDPATRKTPAELAGLCLQALGEGGYDTSAMPGGVFPRANWNNARADLALQQLCDYTACEVVLNPLTDTVQIVRLGVGASAVSLNELLPKVSHAPRAYIPSQIVAVGGDTVFQHKLQLRNIATPYATGQQVLFWTTTPDAGGSWTTESPLSFPGATDTNNRPRVFEQAHREFRVMGQADGTLAIPNFPYPVTSTDQYLLNDYLLETETDLGGFKRNMPAYVSGDYYAWTDLPNNTSDARYTGRFDLDRERRIVKFPYPIFKLSSSGAYSEPTLYLTTSYRARDVNGAMARLYRTGAVGGSGGTLFLKRPEVFAIYSSSTTPGAQTNTEAQAIQELDAYVALFQQKYANPLASEITYPGLLTGPLDGNIAQVTWRWFLNGNANAATTSVYENYEGDISAVDRNERRRREILAQIQEAVL